MQHIHHRYATLALACTMSAFLASPGMAWAINEAASLARGAQPDMTAQQRYQSAIREAGGGLKVARAECKEEPAQARKACEAEAQARYKEDMARARAMLKNPELRPVNVVGEPIRSTEVTTVIKP